MVPLYVGVVVPVMAVDSLYDIAMNPSPPVPPGDTVPPPVPPAAFTSPVPRVKLFAASFREPPPPPPPPAPPADAADVPPVVPFPPATDRDPLTVTVSADIYIMPPPSPPLPP